MFCFCITLTQSSSSLNLEGKLIVVSVILCYSMTPPWPLTSLLYLHIIYMTYLSQFVSLSLVLEEKLSLLSLILNCGMTLRPSTCSVFCITCLSLWSFVHCRPLEKLHLLSWSVWPISPCFHNVSNYPCPCYISVSHLKHVVPLYWYEVSFSPCL